jgi:N-formylglutamate amidohydrolase
MTRPSFDLFQPQKRTSPLVFASPHSGRDYDRGFRRASILGERQLRSSEDAFVDLLFAAAPRYGAPLLCARKPRAYVDLNRGADELDPALIRDVKRAEQPNARVTSGLGVIPRVVAGGRVIYRGKIERAEALERLDTHWYPYHARLEALIGEAMGVFGEAVLIDCHSMPREAIDTLCRHEKVKPEVVLGDRFGAAAAGDVVDRIETAFVEAGLKVLRNKPFAGAYTAQRYGRPSKGQHVVQIEIDRSLYMNETELRPNGNFKHMQRLITGVIAALTGADEQGDQLPLAAE